MTKEEFNQLIEKYLSGKCTPSEERLIDDFFSAQEKTRVEALDDIESEEMWASVSKRIGASPEIANGTRGVGRLHGISRFTSIAVAVVSLCVLVYAGVTVYTRGEKIIESTVTWVTAESERGQKSLVTLADGTRVFLNAESTITYPETFRDDRREIILSGEAFFEVARDETRPFTVRTDNIVTRVLGTSFNVEAFDKDNISVTVVSGKVQVQATNAHSSAIMDQVVLKPNEQAVYDGQSSSLVLKSVDVTKEIAWKDNNLYFDGNSLEEVARELERWYNVKIAFRSEGIKACRINGQYKDMELQSVLKSIQYMYKVNFHYLNQNSIELDGKGCK